MKIQKKKNLYKHAEFQNNLPHLLLFKNLMEIYSVKQGDR